MLVFFLHFLYLCFTIKGSKYANLILYLLCDVTQDDILPKLMTFTGSQEDLFRKEIAKYDHICEEISQNIEAQEQLLLQIQVQNSCLFRDIPFILLHFLISIWELLLSFNLGILVW